MSAPRGENGGRPPGLPKTGGHVAGTPNRTTVGTSPIPKPVRSGTVHSDVEQRRDAPLLLENIGRSHASGRLGVAAEAYHNPCRVVGCQRRRLQSVFGSHRAAFRVVAHRTRGFLTATSMKEGFVC
jgi:hypothetical protein